MAEAVAGILVTAILDKLIETSIQLVTNEVILLAGVKEEIEKLRNILVTINGVLFDAERKKFTNNLINLWLVNLKEAAYDAEDILDRVAIEPRKVQNPITRRATKLIYRHKIAWSIKRLLRRVEYINKTKDSFGLQSLEFPSPLVRDTYHETLTTEFVGRNQDKDKIINDLTSTELSVVSIIGMGGMGKTALAQLVYDDEQINRHFELKLWVVVTANFDLHRIYREIIQSDPEKKNDNLNLSPIQLKNLCFQVLSNKRFFLVLDDVWTHNIREWDALKALLVMGERRGGVLVTSRLPIVGDCMKNVLVAPCRTTSHNLEKLNNEESKYLFRNRAFRDGRPIPSGLEEFAERITTNCDGLPLAIKAMGDLLCGNRDATYWDEISRNEIWELEENTVENETTKVMPILKLSFDHLPSYLKPCFLICSLFPKSHFFDKSELIKIWIAEGYIPVSSGSKLEDLGNRFFNELQGRSFFLSSDVSRANTYRIHDLHHDLACSISGQNYVRVKKLQVEEPSSIINKNPRHVSLLCEDLKQPTSDLIKNGRKVRTILLPGDNLRNFGQISNEELDNEIREKQIMEAKTLKDLFRSLKHIRVLDLSSSSIDALPKSIKKLQLLRYLDLSETAVRTLPNSICSLINLQTLRLLRCLFLDELPKDLAKLKDLRHLELDDYFWYKLSRFPAGAGSLTNLHNLHKFMVVRNQKGYGIEEPNELKSLTGTLHLLGLENVVDAENAKLNDKPNLNDVVFEWNDYGAPIDEAHQKSVLHNLHPHPNVLKLQIINYRGKKFPEWVTGRTLQSLTRVSLNHCTNCKTLPLDELPELKELYLKQMHALEKLTAEKEDCWPKLEKLKILGCHKLPTLPKRFPKLLALEIKKCNLLKDLPATESLKYLTLVENASLENWNDVVRYWDEGLSEEIEDELPKLHLKIQECPMLNRLPKVRLEKLEISNCAGLRNIRQLDRLCHKHLKNLALDDSLLLSVIPDSNSLESLVLSNISKLTSLTNLPRMRGLKALYIQVCNDLQRLWEGEHGNLDGLTPALKFLSIKNCGELEGLPECGLPTKLECLIIMSCGNFKNLGTNEKLKYHEHLKDLNIESCPSLESLPEGGFHSSLIHLKIFDCRMIAERICQSQTERAKINNINDIETDFNVNIPTN